MDVRIIEKHAIVNMDPTYGKNPIQLSLISQKACTVNKKFYNHTCRFWRELTTHKREQYIDADIQPIFLPEIKIIYVLAN